MNPHPDPEQFRQAPQNIEAEQALLGAILINNEAYDRVSSFLEPEHFNEAIHRDTYAAIGKLIAKRRSATPITVKDYLPKDDKVGDITVTQYLARLVTLAVSIVNAYDFGLAIHEHWIRRQLISACDEIGTLAYEIPDDRDVLDEIAAAEEKLTEIRSMRIRGYDGKGLGDRYLENLNRGRSDVEGVPLPLPEIGRVLSEPSLAPGNIYGLLSSSGEGKTSLTLQIIGHALESGNPVLFLSYDQSPEQCIQQMAAQQLKIEYRRQRFRDLDEKEWDRITGFALRVNGLPLEIKKCTNEKASQLCGYARQFAKRTGKVGKPILVVVDHIGAVTPAEQRVDEGTKARSIAQAFKIGAEQTNAAWLILNQRNSYGMKRDNPRPISQDLYGGEAAKQPYDAIFYLYRFKKFHDDKMAVASSGSDFTRLEDNKIFPATAVAEDHAEIGAIKVRFGRSDIKERIQFEAKFTRYQSLRIADQKGFEGI